MAAQMSIASLALARDLSAITRWSDELPRAASDPRVTVLTDLDAYTCGACAVCWTETPAVYRISFRYTHGGTPYPIDVCGRSCAQQQLSELLERGLYMKPAVDITLILPVEFAPVSVESRVAA